METLISYIIYILYYIKIYIVCICVHPLMFYDVICYIVIYYLSITLLALVGACDRVCVPIIERIIDSYAFKSCRLPTPLWGNV